MAATILRRETRAVTVEMLEGEQVRLAKGSGEIAPTKHDAKSDRPTCAMRPEDLLGLIEQAGGLDPDIEVVVAEPRRAPTVPPDERPTTAIDPEAFRALVKQEAIAAVQRPAVLPVYRASRVRWPFVAMLLAAAAAAVAWIVV